MEIAAKCLKLGRWRGNRSEKHRNARRPTITSELRNHRFLSESVCFAEAIRDYTGASRTFARPFHGPYRITRVDVNNAYICCVNRPQDEPILVALQRLRRCPHEVAEEFWPHDGRPKKQMLKFPSRMKAAAVTELDKKVAEQRVLPPPPVLPSVNDVAKPADKGKYSYWCITMSSEDS